MSAAARKWLDRQHVADGTLLLVLRAMADLADKNGRCNKSQTGIAHHAGLGERAVRNSIRLLDHIGMITRDRRSSGGKAGRMTDLVHLAIDHSFDLSRERVSSLRSVGATGTKDRLHDVGATGTETWVQAALLPARKAVAPKPSRVDVESIPSKVGLNHHVSGRVWLDRKRSAWRAAVRLDGVDFTLGRFATEAEAARALRGALTDIEHAASNRSGSPRDPHTKTSAGPANGESLGQWLFGNAPRPPATPRPSSQSPADSHYIRAIRTDTRRLTKEPPQ
ncbi:helix-turn-helix domain-containing protein [Mesorhizobium sp. M0058]|uniref:helix-turn-helix domain-containing protein n=1 Tax=Mesorhizobium sp. M0058 TaxID=2956865 RepID=UPI0033377088